MGVLKEIAKEIAGELPKVAMPSCTKMRTVRDTENGATYVGLDSGVLLLKCGL